MKINKITRNGRIVIAFNQDLIVPSMFQEKNNTKGRSVLTLEELDVQRDVIDCYMAVKSDSEPEDTQFFIEIVEWSKLKLELQLNYTSPHLVS